MNQQQLTPELSKQIIRSIWKRIKDPNHFIHEKYSSISRDDKMGLSMDILAEVAIVCCGADECGFPDPAALPEDVAIEYLRGKY